MIGRSQRISRVKVGPVFPLSGEEREMVISRPQGTLSKTIIPLTFLLPVNVAALVINLAVASGSEMAAL